MPIVSFVCISTFNIVSKIESNLTKKIYTVRNVDKELSRMTYVHNFGILLWADQALRNLHYVAAVKPSGKISPFN